jgi:hypothetical protein
MSAPSFKRPLIVLVYLLPGVVFTYLIARLIALPTTSVALALAVVVLLALVLSQFEFLEPYLDLLLLTFYLAAFNLVYFGDVVLDMPRDTTSVYEFFYVYYNHFLQFDRIPLWFPDLLYGVRTALYQTGFITPSSYLMMVFGKILDIRNSYLLFVSSAFLSQLIFLLGMYALARALGFSRLTRVLLSFVATASLLWYQHSFFELSLPYLLPTQLFLLYKACTTLKGGYLGWLAMSFGLWMIGGLYAPILGFYVCLVFGIVLLVALRKWPRFTFTRHDLILFVIALLLAGVVIALFLAASTDTAFPGRGSTTLHNSQPLATRSGLESFDHLVINFLDPLNGNIFTRSTYEQNLRTYVGLLPLVLLFFALWKREEAAAFYAAWITGLFVIWLTFGELFAQLAIRLPLLVDYRWLGLSYPEVRVLFAVAAMYGFERGIRAKHDAKSVLIILISIAFFLDGALAMVHEEQGAGYSLSNLSILLLRLGFYLLAVLVPVATAVIQRRRSTPFEPWTMMRYTLAFALVLDLVSYQLIWAGLLPKQKQVWSADTVKAFTVVSPIQYLPERPLLPNAGRAKLISKAGFFRDFHYPIAYEFGEFDPCRPVGSIYVQIIEARTDEIRRLIDQLYAQDVPFSPNVNALIGCDLPKLRFVPGTVVQEQITPEQLVTQDLISNVVLPEGTAEAAQAPQRNESAEEITVVSYSYDRLEAEVDNPYDPGAWLLYSDSYQSSWKAAVDGKATEVHRADINFKAVWVPGGHHLVKFEFINPVLAVLQTAQFWLGAIGSLVLLCALLLVGLRQPQAATSKSLETTGH